MSGQLIRNWWVLAIRGVLAILFGLSAFLFPVVTITAVVMVVGAFLLIDGIFAAIAAFRSAERHQRWEALLIEGLVGIGVGVLTYVWPGITALILMLIVAAWAIVTGILEIMAAIRLRKEIHDEWLLGLGGAISVLLGVLLALYPQAGLIVWTWMMGAYALVFGVLMLALALRLHSHKPHLPHGATTS
jgi:uncharacterized membrane protein HdeD (DUF308 family)